MKKHKILYAEDDQTLAFLTKDNLEQHQYEVDHFANGEQCLKAFNKTAYDICVLDVMMPGMDGFALAEAIRKVNHEIPIIFLSAKTLKEDKLKGLRLNFGDGRQASHWKDNLGLGVMDPTAATGETLVAGPNDFIAFDAIGWDLVPEPSAMMLGCAGLLAAFTRRRR